MKKLTLILLALTMLMGLCACGSKDPADTTASTQNTTIPTTVPTTAPVETQEPQLGSYENGVYSNPYIGIQCTVDQEWYVYNREEMAQLNGLVLDTMTDKDLVEQLKNADVAYLFYAMKDEGLISMNITLEKLNLVNGILLDEKAYAKASVQQLPAALESMGMTGVTAKEEVFSFAGQEHAGVSVYGNYSGVDFYEKLICIKAGEYMAVVTVASYTEDLTGELLNHFSGI